MISENARKVFEETKRTKKYPKCPFCNERDGFILVGDDFVCGSCISKAREKYKTESENRIISEVKRQILEELKSK